MLESTWSFFEKSKKDDQSVPAFGEMTSRELRAFGQDALRLRFATLRENGEWAIVGCVGPAASELPRRIAQDFVQHRLGLLVRMRAQDARSVAAQVGVIECGEAVRSEERRVGKECRSWWTVDL